MNKENKVEAVQVKKINVNLTDLLTNKYNTYKYGSEEQEKNILRILENFLNINGINFSEDEKISKDKIIEKCKELKNLKQKFQKFSEIIVCEADKKTIIAGHSTIKAAMLIGIDKLVVKLKQNSLENVFDNQLKNHKITKQQILLIINQLIGENKTRKEITDILQETLLHSNLVNNPKHKSKACGTYISKVWDMIHAGLDYSTVSKYKDISKLKNEPVVKAELLKNTESYFLIDENLIPEKYLRTSSNNDYIFKIEKTLNANIKEFLKNSDVDIDKLIKLINNHFSVK